ncbi:hypothetical protein P8C59_008995 [Phyllachora maydis]|uniref:Sugar phosphate transporter domain-containing protein n=1 Tax=Phyllachora maydis TaxID=1825666 RepID=A0AAD9MKL8_9PEZI|nr:hypothetical protein P8C59_008995 [Phyllachora maydis]
MSETDRTTEDGDGPADIEAQHKLLGMSSPAPVDVESAVSTATKFSHLAVYFLCNVALTIYNKLVLGQFHYPWLLTACHTGAASLGCYLLFLRGSFALSRLSVRHEWVVVAFSVLFTVNIAVSNISLALVSVPFHQIMRSICPVFTVLVYRLRYRRRYPHATYLSLVPVVLGVGLATCGDYYFTPTGFVLTLLGVTLAVVKTIATNRIMTGPLSLDPLETLMRLSPLACAQALACAWATGELDAFQTLYPAGPPRQLCLVLAGNGLLAFVLNMASFGTNRHAGALTMTVCANVKQCLTVLLGIALFGVRVGRLNGLGMLIALGGAAWYSAVELGGGAEKGAGA